MNNENPNTNVSSDTSEFKTVNPLEAGTSSVPTQSINNTEQTQAVSSTPQESVPNTNSDTVTNSVPSTSHTAQQQEIISQAAQQQTAKVEEVKPVVDNSTPSNPENKDINYKPPGKFKTFVLILFFAGLVAFIIFLPEIQAFIAENGFGKKKSSTENITTGKLVCSLDTNTANLDKKLKRTFVFADNKLESSTFMTTIKGDVTNDEKTLDGLAEQCKSIKSSVSDLDGINISCEYSSGKLVEKESFDYKTYDVEKVRAAYTEAGGDIIEYEYGYDIDKIMTSMRQSGFTCNKEK